MHLEDSHGPAQEGVVIAPTDASHVDQVLLAMETPRDWGGGAAGARDRSGSGFGSSLPSLE